MDLISPLRHMKKNKKLGVIFSMSLMSTFFTPIISHAMPNLDNIAPQEKIRILDNAITENMVSVDDLSKKINDTEADIKTKQGKLTDTERQYQAKKMSINMKNSSNNKNGLNVLNLLLNSNSISDFFQNLEISKAIVTQNDAELNNLNTKETQLRELKVNLQDKYNELKEEKTKLETEKTQLEELKTQVKEEIKKQEEENRRKQAELIANSQAQINNANESVENAVNQPAIMQPINQSAPSSAKAQALISNAEQFLGVPYVWGGTTPSGFDCSGFTQYVYNSVGISIPRIASSQQASGTKVALNQVQPGDLLFFGSPAYHVGMYIGNGQYIHAPQTGDVIKIRNVPWGKISSASRYLQ